MQKYYIAFALFLNLSAAKAVTLRDSIGVENLNGKKLILHQIVPKDTYYSIARRYNVSYKEIMTYNESKYLSLGVIIKVPTNIPFGQAVAAKNTGNAVNPVVPVAGGQDDAVLIEHAVQRKENLNMLAEKYGTTVNEIKRVNNLRSINLQIGQVLKIPAKAGTETEGSPEPVTQTASVPNPTPAPAPVKETPQVQTPIQTQVQNQYKKQNQPAPAKQDTTPKEDPFVAHTVASNETMYSIASKYNLTMDQLKAKNNLSGNSLYVGQKLLISGQFPVRSEERNAGGTAESDTTDSTIKNPSLRLPPSRYGLSQVDEKGMAIWILDQDLDSSKMLVLHRTAPVGTIMQITNPMSKRVTYAKVVGKFTENESTKDVIIVMTKAVADALGALDKRFLCNLTYSGQANEQ